MNSIHLHVRRYDTGESLRLTLEHGRVVGLDPVEPRPGDAALPWIAPSLFDIQINGCDGRSFNSERLAVEDVRHVANVCRRHGIGQFFPTLVTNGFEALQHGLATVHQACEADAALASAIPGIHLEGPYISPEDGPRGAHPRQHVRPPNWEEFQRLQDAAGGRIRLHTLAPETDGAIPFIERLVKSGVVVALGHTAASGQRIREAVAAGARLSTHLGNGCHAMIPRHDNHLWEQLANDGLWASLICDGHHLPPAVIRSFLRAKTPDRVILTSDASSLAGSPPGRYSEWGQEFDVLPSGKIVVPGTEYLAGSWAFTDACLSHLLRLGEVALPQAIDMASKRPRELFGLPQPRFEVGERANFVVFDWAPGEELRVKDAIFV